MITLSIMRKRRGVYLTHWYEDVDGIEEWDAFPTLAEAKRQLASVVDRKRVRWVEDRPGRIWSCDIRDQPRDR